MRALGIGSTARIMGMGVKGVATARASRDTLGIALLKALGIPHDRVVRLEIVIDCNSREYPKLTIERWIEGEDQVVWEKVVENLRLSVEERQQDVLSRVFLPAQEGESHA